MSRYDGLIIPRSYSEYINKTDAATLLQALQLSGVMDNAPTANSNHPVKSSGILAAINNFIPKEILQKFNVNNRPTSANIAAKTDVLSYFLATSNMTTGKPETDGYIIDINWDNSGFHAQLFIPNIGDAKIGYRCYSINGWSNWIYFLPAKYSGDIKLVGTFGKDIQGSSYFAVFNLPQGGTYTGATLKNMSIYGVGSVSDLSGFTPQITDNNLRIYTTNNTYAGKVVSVTVTLT